MELHEGMRDDELEREERLIYLFMMIACAPVLIALALQPREIEGGNALMLILATLAVVGMLAGVIRVYRLRRVADTRRPLR